MGQIELSVELPVAQEAQLGVSSSSCSSNPACIQEGIAERQESGSSCSTSMPATDVQPDSKLKRTNSVRNRAAFFEAMTKCSPEKASFPVSPPHGIPIRRMLPASPSPNDGIQGITPTRVAQHLPHQEVEMVDQGVSETDEASSSPPLLSRPGTSAHKTWLPTHALQQHSLPASDQSPTATQSATTYPPAVSGNQQCIWALGPRPSGFVNTSSESSADISSDDGIELQEQGHVEALENTIERLKAQLMQTDAQSRASASALVCKTQECESLMRVVRELTENRSKLACARTNLAERLAELQHEYMRLMRVADLSRVVSKENVAKAAKATKGLKQVEEEAVRQQSLISYFKERNRNLKDENSELRERICLLERLNLLSYTHESVCMREFQLHALKETY